MSVVQHWHASDATTMPNMSDLPGFGTTNAEPPSKAEDPTSADPPTRALPGGGCS